MPLLLLLLALFYGVPREACSCAQKPDTSTAVAAEHSCCTPNKMESCGASGPLLSKVKDCCGMMGQTTPAIASSIGLLSDIEHLTVKLVDLARTFSFIDPEQNKHIAYVSRDPPYLRGFGSSDSYLYKRVFLI